MYKSFKHNFTHKHTMSYLILLITLFSSTASKSSPIQEADNFEALGKIMREKEIPLLLAVEVSHCNFCTRLKAEHLQPMNNNEGYAKRLIIRTLQMDGKEDITDFNGERISPSELSKKHKAYLTPTLLFLNDKGEEVAKRILGYTSPDYFGFYLDQAIAAAEKEISSTEK